MTHNDSPTAVYRWYDANDQLLYVGVSFDLGTRFASHRYGNDNWQQVRRIELEWFDSRRGALEAEARAIATEHPMWNVRHGVFMKDLQASGRVRLGTASSLANTDAASTSQTVRHRSQPLTLTNGK